MTLDNFLQSFEHLAGFVIVMFALGLLWGLTAFAGRLFTRAGTDAKAQPSAKVSPRTVSATELDEDMVVVAAAAASMIEGPHRIVSMRTALPAAGREDRS